MKYIQIILLITVLLGINACSALQYHDDYEDRGDDEMPSKPGACFSKCLMLATTATDEIEYYRYTGDNPDQKGVVKEYIVIEEGGTKWEKKKANRNCLSADPNDCFVWCLVEKPDKTVPILKVIDTSLVKDYVLDFMEVDYHDTEGGYTKWKEVVCEKDITDSLITKLQSSLISQGYEINNGATGEMNAETKAALVKFQKDYSYPLGGLTIETLQALGVSDFPK